MPTFSHSKIGSFETCPLQYKFQYIDKVDVEQEDTVETFLGSRVHEALEKLYKDLMHEKLNSIKELITFFNDKWKENWNPTVKVTRKEYTADNYRKMGERFISDYYARYKPFNQGKTIGLETQDMISLDPEHKFHVRIDRLVDAGKGVYEIHDYKTNNSLPAQEYLDNDRQLAMYSTWVLQNFKDVCKIKLVWHFLAFDKEMESSRSLKELEELKKEVLLQIKKIESAVDFPANESALCNWCAFQQICPRFKHLFKVEEKSVNEFLNDSGVKLVNEYVKYKNELDTFTLEHSAILEKLKEALIAFALKEGVEVVIGSDKKITVKEYSSVKFPSKGTAEREELIGILKKIGKLDKVTDLDIYALARVVKNKEWDEKEMKKIEEFADLEKCFRVSVGRK